MKKPFVVVIAGLVMMGLVAGPALAWRSESAGVPNMSHLCHKTLSSSGSAMAARPETLHGRKSVVHAGDSLPVLPTLPAPSATYAPAACRLGTGLRGETAPILMEYKDHSGLVMSPSYTLSEVYFPQLEGWIRVLGGPSLEVLRRRAERAAESGLPYEALGYGLEIGESTPEREWQDVVGSTQKARAIADQYGKLLVMGPGLRLMSHNRSKYPAIAAMADAWVLQTQRLQVNPPEAAYRQEVERVVRRIRSGNPDIAIWAQITLPPDREPSAEYWLSYQQSIADLVDGTYAVAYTWHRMEPDQLVAAIDAIFAAVCGSEQ
jgi:hypothetical protein